jgi:hypothetical protein
MIGSEYKRLVATVEDGKDSLLVVNKSVAR